MRIACYGVRPNEIDFFEKLNIYHYDLSLYEELLTHDNIVSAKDHDAVLLRGNCIADDLAGFRVYRHPCNLDQGCSGQVESYHDQFQFAGWIAEPSV